MANKHRSDRQFSVGDFVYVKLQAYRQVSIAARANEKLAPKYFGPYPMISRIGVVAYELKLPDHAKI